jgi:hypothetical protein
LTWAIPILNLRMIGAPHVGPFRDSPRAIEGGRWNEPLADFWYHLL